MIILYSLIFFIQSNLYGMEFLENTNDQRICVICRESEKSLITESKKLIALPCHQTHTYCQTCLVEIKNKFQNCAICRSYISTSYYKSIINSIKNNDISIKASIILSLAFDSLFLSAAVQNQKYYAEDEYNPWRVMAYTMPPLIVSGFMLKHAYDGIKKEYILRHQKNKS